eukprot:2455792-Heterocapsa_arctica.AAC.1
MDCRIANDQMERNRANDKAALRSGNVSGFGKMLAAPAVGGNNPPGKKAQAKAAAKAAKALAAASDADVDAR